MSSGRILVVDDEPQILRALKTNLTAAGYKVETAATAGERLLSRRRIRLTLSSSTSSFRIAAEPR